MLDWHPYFENYDIYLRKILKFTKDGIVGTPTQNVLLFQLDLSEGVIIRLEVSRFHICKYVVTKNLSLSFVKNRALGSFWCPNLKIGVRDENWHIPVMTTDLCSELRLGILLNNGTGWFSPISFERYFFWLSLFKIWKESINTLNNKIKMCIALQQVVYCKNVHTNYL